MSIERIQFVRNILRAGRYGKGRTAMSLSAHLSYVLIKQPRPGYIAFMINRLGLSIPKIIATCATTRNMPTSIA